MLETYRTVCTSLLPLLSLSPPHCLWCCSCPSPLRHWAATRKAYDEGDEDDGPLPPFWPRQTSCSLPQPPLRPPPLPSPSPISPLSFHPLLLSPSTLLFPSPPPSTLFLLRLPSPPPLPSQPRSYLPPPPALPLLGGTVLDGRARPGCTRRTRS